METEINLEALEKNIQESLGEPDDSNVEETEEVAEEATGEENEEASDEVEEAFDLDEALNSDQPIALANKLTEEQAREEAAKRGWKEDGEDRFGHKISAIEFLERAPLFKKISLMRGDIDELNKKTAHLVEQSKQIAQKSLEDKKKLNEELKAAKEKLLSAEYLDMDDVAELKKIDSQLEETTVEDPKLSESDQKLADDYNVAKAKFASDNDWYESDYKMTKMADDVGFAYANNYHQVHGTVPPPEELFKHVKDEVSKAFPSAEKKPKQTRVASNAKRTVVSQIKSKKTLQDLPEEQRAIAREVIESIPNMTEEDYLKTYGF